MTKNLTQATIAAIPATDRRALSGWTGPRRTAIAVSLALVLACHSGEGWGPLPSLSEDEPMGFSERMILSPTAEKAIAAYGGRERWLMATSLEAEVSVSGLAFRLKGRPDFVHARIRMDLRRPWIQITPIGSQPDITARLEGADVSLRDATGAILESRTNARSYFKFGRRLYSWDDLDMGYFANYAFWNYFSLPVLLMNKEIEWQEIKPGHLRARFPDHLPTHSPIQDFYFDQETGLLRQHNYTVEIISVLARAAMEIGEHREVDGIRFAVRRTATPQGLGGGSVGFPVLVDIHVHELKLVAPESR